jgi:hypothetical protein
MQLTGQSNSPGSQELSLEDTLGAFRQTVNQLIQKIIDDTMANTETIARLEGQLNHLVVEFNIVEEEKLQSQEMAKGKYMIDKDGPSNSYHEHVQPTTFGSVEVVKETVNEPSVEDPLEACLAQFRDDLDLDKLFEQAYAILDPTLEVRTENGETTKISFPNSSSLAAEPFIMDNHEEKEKKKLVRNFTWKHSTPTPINLNLLVHTEFFIRL